MWSDVMAGPDVIADKVTAREIQQWHNLTPLDNSHSPLCIDLDEQREFSRPEANLGGNRSSRENTNIRCCQSNYPQSHSPACFLRVLLIHQLLEIEHVLLFRVSKHPCSSVRLRALVFSWWKMLSVIYLLNFCKTFYRHKFHAYRSTELDYYQLIRVAKRPTPCFVLNRTAVVMLCPPPPPKGERYLTNNDRPRAFLSVTNTALPHIDLYTKVNIFDAYSFLLFFSFDFLEEICPLTFCDVSHYVCMYGSKQIMGFHLLLLSVF